MKYFAHRILGTQTYKKTEIDRIQELNLNDDQKRIATNRILDESATFKVLQRCAAIFAGGFYCLLHLFGQVMYSISASSGGKTQVWYTFINENNETVGYIALAAFALYLGGGVKGLLSSGNK